MNGEKDKLVTTSREYREELYRMVDAINTFISEDNEDILVDVVDALEDAIEAFTEAIEYCENPYEEEDD